MRLEELEEELRCCHLQFSAMGDIWETLKQVGTGRMLGYRPEKEVAAYPSQDAVRTLLDKIDTLRRGIEDLQRLLHGPHQIVVTDLPPKD